MLVLYRLEVVIEQVASSSFASTASPGVGRTMFRAALVHRTIDIAERIRGPIVSIDVADFTRTASFALILASGDNCQTFHLRNWCQDGIRDNLAAWILTSVVFGSIVWLVRRTLAARSVSFEQELRRRSSLRRFERRMFVLAFVVALGWLILAAIAWRSVFVSSGLALAGLTLAATWWLAWRRSPFTVEEIELLTKTSVLARLPRFSRRLKALRFRDESRYMDAMRTVRVFLQLSNKYFDSRVIVVTSSEPGAGKTTVALNLARSYAATSSTLLIEADLRRPSLGAELGFAAPPLTPPGGPGLGLASLVLRWPAKPPVYSDSPLRPRDDLRKQPEVAVDPETGLTVILAGTRVGNAGDILASPEMSNFLDRARGDFEVVIIDSPPLVVPDALALSRMADGVLLVMTPRTEVFTLSRDAERLKKCDATVLGIVYNMDLSDPPAYVGNY